MVSIAGLNWVQTQAAASGRPSIATVSIGGGVQPAMDDAVNALIVSGVHVTVSGMCSNGVVIRATLLTIRYQRETAQSTPMGSLQLVLLLQSLWVHQISRTDTQTLATLARWSTFSP